MLLTVDERYIDSPIHAKTEMTLGFNLRVIQEYFEPTLWRTIRIFIMGQKKRKECTQTFKRMTRLNMRGYSDKMIHNNLSEVKNDHKRKEKKKNS